MKRPLGAALGAGVVILLLAGCGPDPSAPTGESAGAGEPADAPAAPPVAAGYDFSGDFNLRGTEPFWNLTIRPGQLTLSRIDHEDFAAPNNGPQADGGTARWDGGPLDVTLTAGTCSDGMSDQIYSYNAVVELEGVAALKGCAERLGAARTPQ